MGSVLTGLWIVEAGITLLAVVLFIWHGLVEFREEDDLFLSEGRTNVVREQTAVQRQAMALERRLRVTCAAWVIVLLAIAAVWVLKQLS